MSNCHLRSGDGALDKTLENKKTCIASREVKSKKTTEKRQKSVTRCQPNEGGDVRESQPGAVDSWRPCHKSSKAALLMREIFASVT